jgi:CRP/FNR family transcriptional regulator, cyclic AMP receptor protein
MFTWPARATAPASRLALLRKLAVFADLGDADLRRVDALACEITVARGRTLARQGEVGREAFVVADGVADVQVDGRTIARVGPGEVLGERALLADEPRSATVATLTDLTVLVMDRAQFAELLADPRIAERVTAAARQRHATTA